MHDHVVDHPSGHLQEFPIKIKGTVFTARAPAMAKVADTDARSGLEEVADQHTTLTDNGHRQARELGEQLARSS